MSVVSRSARATVVATAGLLILPLGPASAEAADPASPTTLVADIFPGYRGSAPTDPVELDGILYFGAKNATRAEELWGYDAATGEAFLAADIPSPGSYGSSPHELATLGGLLYFAASGPNFDTELYVYDPATGDARRAADIEPGPFPSDPQDLTALGGKLYFSAYTLGQGRELWVYDPAADGGQGAATVAAIIAPGATEAEPAYLTVLDGELYFRARDVNFNDELWVYDPSTGSAARVADIQPGPIGSYPSYLVVAAGRLYFSAVTEALGRELWTFDPNTGRTRPAADIVPGVGSSAPEQLAVLGERVYFSADDGLRGRELWRFDPETRTAEIAADISPTGSGALEGSAPTSLTAFDGRLYFAASYVGRNNDRLGDYELWEFNPAANDGAGAASLVQEIRPGSRKGIDSAQVAELTPYAGALYFSARDDVSGQELWRYSRAEIEVAAALFGDDEVTGPGSVDMHVYVRNNTDAAVIGQVRITLTEPDGTVSSVSDGPGPLRADSVAARLVSIPVSRNDEGSYTVTVRVFVADVLRAIDEVSYTVR